MPSNAYQRAEMPMGAKVAETRGKQLVADSYLTEEQRLEAITDYHSWCTGEARSMKLYLKATHARV